MMKLCQKINLQEPQRNRNATANVVNLIRTSTVVVSVGKIRLSRLTTNNGLMIISIAHLDLLY